MRCRTVMAESNYVENPIKTSDRASFASTWYSLCFTYCHYAYYTVAVKLLHDVGSSREFTRCMMLLIFSFLSATNWWWRRSCRLLTTRAISIVSRICPCTRPVSRLPLWICAFLNSLPRCRQSTSWCTSSLLVTIHLCRAPQFVDGVRKLSIHADCSAWLKCFALYGPEGCSTALACSQ